MSVLLIAFLAMGLGMLLIALMKAVPVEDLPGWEEGERAEPGPWVEGLGRLEASDEVKATLLHEMGFADLVRTEVTPERTAFECRTATPLAGGRYVVHFVSRPGRRPVPPSHLERLRSDMRRDKTIMKGLLITTGTFTPHTRERAEEHPIELVDGERLRTLLERHYPAGLGDEPEEAVVGGTEFEDRLEPR